MKDKKRRRISKSTVIQLIVGAVIGAALASSGFITGYNDGSEEKELKFVVLEFIIFIGSLFLGTVIHTILHEAGHLIGGFISGYQFTSFRIFNSIFIKENGRLIRKKYNIPGTMGQCLMTAPESADGDYPFMLYNLGGGLFNFLWSGIFFVVYMLVKDIFYFAGILFFALVAVGIILGVMNLLPLTISGVTNDGYNIILLRKKEEARRGFYFGLNANASAMRGIRYKEMPAEWSELPNDYDDSMSVMVALNRLSCLMDNHDFDAARELAEKILSESKNLIGIYKNELYCELLFIELIQGCCLKEIERLYTDDLQKYIKASRFQLPKQRLIYAYQKLVALDEKEADKALVKFNKTCLTYPYKGALALELELIEIINEISQKSL